MDTQESDVLFPNGEEDNNNGYEISPDILHVDDDLHMDNHLESTSVAIEEKAVSGKHRIKENIQPVLTLASNLNVAQPPSDEPPPRESEPEEMGTPILQEPELKEQDNPPPEETKIAPEENETSLSPVPAQTETMIQEDQKDPQPEKDSQQQADTNKVVNLAKEKKNEDKPKLKRVRKKKPKKPPGTTLQHQRMLVEMIDKGIEPPTSPKAEKKKYDDFLIEGKEKEVKNKGKKKVKPISSASEVFEKNFKPKPQILHGAYAKWGGEPPTLPLQLFIDNSTPKKKKPKTLPLANELRHGRLGELYRYFLDQEESREDRVVQDLACLDRRQLLKKAREMENLAFRLSLDEAKELNTAENLKVIPLQQLRKVRNT
uniref:Uncharacterized protein n=1 Tax=Aplanochytrium stocchinoi TaxID=215587 RepID=A0A6S8BTH4_9STRA|mmetsp:Transcript_17401/g.20904  ORF Transcript_17401/g.20904 Transcript_17401/m.20904 type:complete len:373 (-) Transcript_17401:1382-2500(-)|eukprot:CAMPEP_0204843062 /NCGR_PEP_ID=MMETSP1346-20131115/47753_1 /ASSEMBLY_ACC=CAM_ASM_000771 /TAXON_ID=215587 /ORGANISM="Aplanochytrium stocchinoi, Strain GSBS06" /LENGTH=372 /DNA_ID=CAMNT_0051982131 /DNA_START=217 /DNA_END=1335 /DNA_ORIENTATION=+